MAKGFVNPVFSRTAQTQTRVCIDFRFVPNYVEYVTDCHIYVTSMSHLCHIYVTVMNFQL